VVGGGQEQNYRSGTENLPAIAGFGAAVAAQNFALDREKMTALLAKFRQELSNVEGLELLGAGDAPHILSVSLAGLRSQGILNCLQDKGFYVSAGSACSRGHRSHVLTAMGLSPKVVDGAVRISIDADTPDDAPKALADAFRYAKNALKG
jgi:cysteine desulfurase